VTYSQFDSNIHVFYVFLGFLKNTWKYLIQRPIFKPLYFYNVFLKTLENTSFWAPSKNTRISYVTICNEQYLYFFQNSLTCWWIINGNFHVISYHEMYFNGLLKVTKCTNFIHLKMKMKPFFHFFHEQWLYT
jgi:hypothetical protein